MSEATGGIETAAWREAYDLDREYVLHSWSVQGALKPLCIAKGEGARFWDENGKEFYDFASQLVNLNVGFQHPMVVKAIKDQADRMCTVAPQFVSDVRSKLAKRIVDMLPEAFGKCFFTVGGADANENAVKMARAYTGRHKIIARYRSYHGATYGAIALTGDPRRPPVEPAMPGVVHVLDPYCYRCSFGQNKETCGLQCAEHVAEIIAYENPNTVAAVIMEPITGSNGIFVPPPGYMERVAAICKQHGILFICDEVMTGFGRTGKTFGFEHFDIVPDIVTMAKGVNSGYIPLGVVAATKEVSAFFDDKMLWCGLTYSGHPLACAAAMGCLDAYEADGCVENAATLGAVLAQELEGFKARHACVGDVRSIGLFSCVELVKNKDTREPMCPWNGAPGLMAEVAKALREQGLNAFVRWNFIFLAPPLVITETQLREGLRRVDAALTVGDGLIAQ